MPPSESPQKPIPYTVYVSEITAKDVHVFISEKIGAPEDYTNLIHQIQTSSSNDTIYIHLNTPGGRIDTGVQIINAMKQSSARIITVLDGTAASMGALIFIAAEEFIINDHCRLMFHNYSGGVAGKGHEIISAVESTTEWAGELYRDLCIPFLTEEECEGIIQGKDMWCNSEEVRIRANNMIEIQSAERDAEETGKAKPKAKSKPKAKTKAKKP